MKEYAGLYPQYGAVSNGTKMLIKVLQQQFQESGSDSGLVLHRNLDIYDSDGKYPYLHRNFSICTNQHAFQNSLGTKKIQLREDVTHPVHKDLTVTKVFMISLNSQISSNIAYFQINRREKIFGGAN